MESFQQWQNLFKSSSNFTNVKIITKDRKEKNTHKLFLVSINEMFRSLLFDQMETANSVIIVPDKTLEEVEIELEELLIGCQTSKGENTNECYEDLNDKPFDGDVSDEDSASSEDYDNSPEEDDDNTPNIVNNTSKCDNVKEDSEERYNFGIEIDISAKDEFDFKEESEESSKGATNNDTSDKDELELAQNDEVVDLKIAKAISSKRQNLTLTCSTETKKQKYDKAIEAYFRYGNYLNLKKISEIHGVARTTLHELIKKGKSFSGSGSKVGKYFSKCEEEMLAEKTKSLVRAGFELTWANFRDLIKQELDSIVSKDSKRTTAPPHWPNVHYARRFAARYSLKEHIVKMGSGGPSNPLFQANCEKWEKNNGSYLL